jgi:hypothetical protein
MPDELIPRRIRVRPLRRDHLELRQDLRVGGRNRALLHARTSPAHPRHAPGRALLHARMSPAPPRHALGLPRVDAPLLVRLHAMMRRPPGPRPHGMMSRGNLPLKRCPVHIARPVRPCARHMPTTACNKIHLASMFHRVAALVILRRYLLHRQILGPLPSLVHDFKKVYANRKIY